MRIIFLNSWYANAGKDYYNFISNNSKTTDIFGLTEVHPEMFTKLQEMLPDFQGFYDRLIFDRNMGFIYGQAVFVKGKISVRKFDMVSLYRNVYNDIGGASPFQLKIGPKNLWLMNIHGKARPGTKLDTPARIRQSRKIISFLADKKGPKIIGGDFNLEPNTRSVRMFKKARYKNLIKEFGIKNTRNRLSWEQFPEEVKKYGKQYFADYIFVSSEVKIKAFEVPNIEISDHLPLILDFEI